MDLICEINIPFLYNLIKSAIEKPSGDGKGNLEPGDISESDTIFSNSTDEELRLNVDDRKVDDSKRSRQVKMVHQRLFIPTMT